MLFYLFIKHLPQPEFYKVIEFNSFKNSFTLTKEIS